MRNLYLMRARPFGLGTFPEVEIVLVEDGNKRRDGYWSKVETVKPLTEEQIKSFELVQAEDE